jgi:hypothetical protein
MLAAVRGRSRASGSEEGDALYGAVMAVTAATGGMLALFDGAGHELPLTAAPAIVMLVAVAGRKVTAGAWAAVAVWVLVLPLAPGLAILAPVSMILVCAAFAIGPGRLIDWVRDDWIGGDQGSALDAGWIEDDRTER